MPRKTRTMKQISTYNWRSLRSNSSFCCVENEEDVDDEDFFEVAAAAISSSTFSIPFFKIDEQISAHNSILTCFGQDVVVDDAKMADTDEALLLLLLLLLLVEVVTSSFPRDEHVNKEVERRTAFTRAEITEGDGRLGKEEF